MSPFSVTKKCERPGLLGWVITGVLPAIYTDGEGREGAGETGWAYGVDGIELFVILEVRVLPAQARWSQA